MDTEILEIIPEKLQGYLKNDEDMIIKIDSKINDMNQLKDSYDKEKVEKIKDIEDRLEQFKKELDAERESMEKEIDTRISNLLKEKENVEKVKEEQLNRKQEYIKTLTSINDKYNSKIETIENAINACSDNDTLKQALIEEKEKLNNDLDIQSNNRKEIIDNVLLNIGIGEKVTEEVSEENNEIEVEIKTSSDVKLNDEDDFDEETYNKFMALLNEKINSIDNEPVASSKEIEITTEDNEVVEHESKEEVINEIYESEEIMEGIVFPYLKGLLGE